MRDSFRGTERLADTPTGHLNIVMHRKSRCAQLLIATFVVVLAFGCSSRSPEPDAGALALREMAGQALTASGIDEPVLRQISVNPPTGRFDFAVTDKDATFGVQIFIDALDQPPNEWRVVPMEFIRYEADVSLDVDSVNVGATAAMAGATEHWPGCVPRGQTVIGSTEGNDQWVVFCDIPEGTVSGWVDAETGEFTPSKAPPAIAPVTATPGEG